MQTSSIAENLTSLRETIRDAARDAGRNEAAVRLVAVSKTVDTDAVREAYDAGQRDFGENRVQELLRKAEALPEDCCWHLIGHLQRNKVRPAIQAADWIHSVDSVALIERIDRLAEDEGVKPNILLQVNVSGEESKYGIPPEEAPALLDAAMACDHLTCQGLMTMAPYGADDAALEGIFGALRDLRDQLRTQTGQPLPHLSMGMSGDYQQAIAHGATMVRIGTAVFGHRE